MSRIAFVIQQVSFRLIALHHLTMLGAVKAMLLLRQISVSVFHNLCLILEVTHYLSLSFLAFRLILRFQTLKT